MPPKGANTIEVKFSNDISKERIRGNFNSVLEVACSDFENLPIQVNAFVGQPIYFPVWERVFFKPCKMVGEQRSLVITLINESQYDIRVCSVGLAPNDSKDSCQFLSSLPVSSESKPAVVTAYGILPVTFTFIANEAGAFMRKVQLRILDPIDAVVTAVLRSNVTQTKQLLLYGTCIDASRNPVKCLEDVLKWINDIGKKDDDMLDSYKEYTSPPPLVKYTKYRTDSMWNLKMILMFLISPV